MAPARGRLGVLACVFVVVALAWFGLSAPPAAAQSPAASPGATAATGGGTGQRAGATPPVTTGVALGMGTQAIGATSPVTPTKAAGNGGGPDAAALLRISLLAVFFGSFALVTVLVYIYHAQKLFFTAAKRLALSNKTVQATAVTALERKDRDQPTNTASRSPIELDFAGPATVSVGKASPPYTATVKPDPGIPVTWSVEPPAAAAVQPLTGLSVVVVAAIEGAFTLKATATPTDGTPATKAVQVAAIRTASADVTLPFVGQGYGSVVIAIILLTVVVWLGLAGVLDGQAVATVLGGLVGFVFGSGLAGRGAGGGAAGGGADNQVGDE